MAGQAGIDAGPMQHPRYTKRLQADTALEGEPGPDGSIELQVTLGDMGLEDAFRVTLPPAYARLRLGELFDQVFREDAPQEARIRQGFNLKENPDLPEMYDALIEVFRDWRGGRCTLRFYVNHGPEMELSDEVGRHLVVRRPGGRGESPGGLLDLVIEQRYRALEYAVDRGFGEGVQQLLEWLQARTLLYFMDRHGFSLEADPGPEVDRRLLPIALGLCELNIVAPSQEKGTFEITREGRRALADMIAEVESNITHYDVFGDVVYDRKTGTVEFDTGRGDDLRVQVYEVEGLDPVRTLFLHLLYDGSLDSLPTDWRDAIHDREFFEGLLSPVVDRDEIDADLMEQIIESGLAQVEEREEESNRAARRRELLARAKKR
jgi:hypothetical protein